MRNLEETFLDIYKTAYDNISHADIKTSNIESFNHYEILKTLSLIGLAIVDLTGVIKRNYEQNNNET